MRGAAPRATTEQRLRVLRGEADDTARGVGLTSSGGLGFTRTGLPREGQG